MVLLSNGAVVVFHCSPHDVTSLKGFSWRRSLTGTGCEHDVVEGSDVIPGFSVTGFNMTVTVTNIRETQTVNCRLLVNETNHKMEYNARAELMVFSEFLLLKVLSCKRNMI